MVTGGFVAVMAGFITTHQGMSRVQLQLAIVGLAAVSSRELLDFVPAAVRRFVQVQAVVNGQSVMPRKQIMGGAHAQESVQAQRH